MPPLMRCRRSGAAAWRHQSLISTKSMSWLARCQGAQAAGAPQIAPSPGRIEPNNIKFTRIKIRTRPDETVTLRLCVQNVANRHCRNRPGFPTTLADARETQQASLEIQVRIASIHSEERSVATNTPVVCCVCRVRATAASPGVAATCTPPRPMKHTEHAAWRVLREPVALGARGT